MGKELDEVFALVTFYNAIIVSKEEVERCSNDDISNKMLEKFGSSVKKPVFEDCVVSWVGLYHADEIGQTEKPESILRVTDLQGQEIRDFNVEKQAKLAAIAFRVKQIQQEYGITGTDPIIEDEIISNLLERVWAGEWMGQFNSGKVIYYNELADLLNVKTVSIWPLIEELIAQRKADWIPSTWILMEPQGETPVKWTSEAEGHKEFSSSDFGWWACSFCDQRGDDYSNPKDFPCVETS